MLAHSCNLSRILKDSDTKRGGGGGGGAGDTFDQNLSQPGSATEILISTVLHILILEDPPP